VDSKSSISTQNSSFGDVLRFLGAGVGATVFSIIFAMVVFSFLLVDSPEEIFEYTFLFIAVGGSITLTLACVFGGSLIILSKVNPHAMKLRTWLAFGAIAGLFIKLLSTGLGGFYPFVDSALICGGIIAAFIFRSIWLKQ
jgi:hypothetical protein